MKKIVFAAFSMFLLGAGSATAQTADTQDHQWQFRLRGLGVVPNESASISAIGGDVDISNALVPELDITYYFTKHIAVELILGTTKHDVNTVASDLAPIGGGITDVDLGSVRLLPPTLTAQYHFYPTESIKPYVGAGINYTLFYDVDPGKVVKDVEYENAFGFAFQVGSDFFFNDNFFVNLDAKYIMLKTDVTVNASNLAPDLSIPAEVTINPLLLGIGIGYRF